jgi:hypothetical protein
LIVDTEFFQQPGDAARTGRVEVMDFDHAGFRLFR